MGAYVNMRRILLVHNYYQIPGGEDTVVKNEKQMLEEHGHEVILYTRSNEELKAMNIIQKCFLPLTAIFSLKTYREVRRIIKEEKIDIVHVHNTLTMITPSVFCAANSCKVPLVQTLHNFRMICPNGLFFCDGQVCERCLDKGIGYSIKHSCYRQSRAQTLVVVLTMLFHRMIGTYKKVSYICLTEFNRQKLLSKNKSIHFVKDKNVFVKPNFTQFKDSECIGEKCLGQAVFVGRIEEGKGIVSLLEAWKEIKDVELLLCGTGSLKEWATEYCSENGISNVKMMGFTQHDEIMKIISESEFLILPSLWYEGFPMTIVESMACGTPILCSDIGNLGSLIENGFNGYKFRAGDAFDIKRAVREMMNCSYKAEMYQNCRKCFAEKYSEEANYQQLMDIYAQIEKCGDCSESEF